MIYKRKNIIIPIILFFITGGVLYATQQHKEPTGLVVHQIAHLMFIFAMAFLMVTIKKTVGTRVAGWRNLYWAAFFFMLWNILAWLVHGIQEYIPRSAYTGSSYWSVYLTTEEQIGLRVIFYIGKILGPILNVVPFFFLYKSLKSFAKISL